MPPRDRRLQKARQNPKSLSFREIRLLYEDHGFSVRSGGKGSHYIAALPGTPITRTFPRRNPMKSTYVRQALNAIEEAHALGYLEEDLSSD